MESQGILILAEHDGNHLKPSTASVVSAAKQLPGPITVLVVGESCATVAESASRLQGITAVWLAEAPCFKDGLAENGAALIAELGKEFAYILAPATTYGKNILPRAAALLDVGQISEIIRVLSADTFVRPIYAGNALATIQALDPIKVITVRTTAFDPVLIGTTPVVIKNISHPIDLRLTQFVRKQENVSLRPELTSARVVIAGGRGLQNGENFKLLEDIADKLGGALGASRAAVDAGYVPNDYQVGQTGKVVAPDLYIAVGISGAIQHLAGMKDSKVIVAINQDADAPIFQVADYGLVGDLFTILPELSQELAIRMEQSQVE